METSSFDEQEFPAKDVKGVLLPLDLSFKLVTVPEILQWIADNCSSLKYIVKTVCCPQKVPGCEWGKEFTVEWEEYLQELGAVVFLMLLPHLNCSCLAESSQGVLWTLLKEVQVAGWSSSGKGLSIPTSQQNGRAVQLWHHIFRYALHACCVWWRHWPKDGEQRRPMDGCNCPKSGARRKRGDMCTSLWEKAICKHSAGNPGYHWKVLRAEPGSHY